jgi:hypothetical protein
MKTNCKKEIIMVEQQTPITRFQVGKGYDAQYPHKQHRLCNGIEGTKAENNDNK